LPTQSDELYDFRNAAMHAMVIEEICKPLYESFNVSRFMCTVIFKDNRFFTLGNQYDFIEYCAKNNILQRYPEIILNAYSKKGAYVHTSKPAPFYDKFPSGDFEKFGEVTCSLRLLDVASVRNNDAIIIYSFDVLNASSADDCASQFINNIDLFKEFARYFYKRFKVTIANKNFGIEFEANEMEAFETRFDDFIENSDSSKDISRNNFSIWLYKHLYKNAGKKPFLTPKETEILKLTIQEGCTSTQVAGRLNISKRTVDRHFENMRLKFSVFTKPELIKSAVALGLIAEPKSAFLMEGLQMD